MITRSRRTVALVLGSLVTAFWLWFGIASGIGEALGAGNLVMHLLLPGGVFLATLAVAWRWGRIGGALFLLEGLVVGLGYPLKTLGRFPLATVVMVVLTMSLPLLIAGALLLVDRSRKQTTRPGGA